MIFLPGFSNYNKKWAEETKKEIENEIDLTIHEWPHWQTGEAKEGWIDNEADKIVKEVGGEKVNVLAKSVGTLVAVKILNKKLDLINKIVLCGIPLKSLKESDKENYDVLGKISAEKILVIQNENDMLGGFEEVNKMIKKINSNILVISKPKDDHDYPYADDFKNFLKQDSS